ncbi:MAG: hypothetical protein GX207_03420 [Peptococcaceae bacterium]|nr:hypothetical protein [Peptococcaceae bacterium]
MVYKKTLFGYKEEEVKQHLRNLEKDYTEKLKTKRQKLREILDKNNKLRNQIDLVAGETERLISINRTYSKSINVFMQEIKDLENKLTLIKKEEERKRITSFSMMEQKVKEFKSFCSALNSSMEELTSIIQRNKMNGAPANSQDSK